MDYDKQTELIKDVEEDGGSNCCGAKVYGDICADCKEHCESVDELMEVVFPGLSEVAEGLMRLEIK